MNMLKNIKYFPVDPDILKVVGGEGSQVFSNGIFSMVVNGSPIHGNLIRAGNFYHIPEGRILIVLEGRAKVHLNLEEHQIEKGTVVVTAPDNIMEMKYCSEDMCVIGIVLKDQIFVQENIIQKTTPEEYEEILRMSFLLWDVAHHVPFRNDTVCRMVEAIVSNIQYIHKEKQNSIQTPPTRGQLLFQQFKTLVSKHCEQERNIPFYAGLLHVTPHHLSSVISKTSGQSVMYWINRAVTLHAKMLLKTTGLMGYEIADRLNFPNAPAFNKFFKRETGMTPKQFQSSGT